jgi:hypothetical protein
MVFDEVACWDWESGDGEATAGGLSSSFTVEYSVLWCRGAGPRRARGADLRRDIHCFQTGEAPAPPQSPEGEEVAAAPPSFATPPPVISPHVDASYSGEPLRFREVDDFVGDASPPGQVARMLDDLELHLAAQRSHLASWRQSRSSAGGPRCLRR